MNRTLAVPLLAILLAVAGCKNDFSPQSDLLDLRVLALVASPLDVTPSAGTVTIRPFSYVPPGSPTPLVEWTFCPLSVGAVTAYACAIPACETSSLDPAEHWLRVGSDGTLTASPAAIIDGKCPQLRLAAAQGAFQSVFRFRITIGSETRDAILQLPVWLLPPPSGWEPNLPPVILEVRIGGRPAASPPPLPVNGALPVELIIDPASVQTYVDAAGVAQTETMTGYYYTDAGTFDKGVLTGTDTTSQLQGIGIPATRTSAQVWVVALDLRGGQAVAGPFTVPIGP
ncbi:MAG: hypothetical protein WCK73_01185 [Deltaproteobacteria bacterium]